MPPTISKPVAPGAPVPPAPAVTAKITPMPSAKPTPVDAGKSVTARIVVKAEGTPPATVKPTIKKETVRIEVPTGGPKPIPQATVKIQPAPVAAKPPEAVVRTITPAPVPTIKSTVSNSEEDAVAEHDPMVTYAAYGVLFFAAITFTIQLLTYLAS